VVVAELHDVAELQLDEVGHVVERLRLAPVGKAAHVREHRHDARAGAEALVAAGRQA
jgi:hypothetical protein